MNPAHESKIRDILERIEAQSMLGQVELVAWGGNSDGVVIGVHLLNDGASGIRGETLLPGFGRPALSAEEVVDSVEESGLLDPYRLSIRVHHQ